MANNVLRVESARIDACVSLVAVHVQVEKVEQLLRIVRELTEHLNSYYEEVVSRIRDAESILILGPGEAKGELKARLEKDKLGGRVVADCGESPWPLSRPGGGNEFEIAQPNMRRAFDGRAPAAPGP